MKYNESDFEIIEEYLAFLEENEFCFYCSEAIKENFTDLDVTFNYPATISNAVLELDSFDSHKFENYMAQLAKLNCTFIAIYINFSIIEADVLNLLAVIKSFGFDHVNLVLNQSIAFDLREMKRKYPILNTIINKETSDLEFYDEENCLKVKKNIKTINKRSCGCVNEGFFNLQFKSLYRVPCP